MGRAKPGHFEKMEICSLSLASGSPGKSIKWRTYSGRRDFKQF
jgi:hypothetical protein